MREGQGIASTSFCWRLLRLVHAHRACTRTSVAAASSLPPHQPAKPPSNPHLGIRLRAFRHRLPSPPLSPRA